MDAFDLLGLPRRPWLDPAEVRAAFQSRARALHPDAPGGDTAAFARLNAAQRELAAPASRLRLLAGDEPVPAAPPDFDFGFRVGAFTREADALLEKWRAAASPLGRALLGGDLKRLHECLAALQADLAARRAAIEGRLRAVSPTDRAALARLAGDFTFLDRWTTQLRDRALELRVEKIPPPPPSLPPPSPLRP